MRLSVHVSIAVMVLAALVSHGCAATPTKRWAQAREALTASQNILAAHVRAGRLSDEQIQTCDALIRSARGGLEVAEAQLPAGGESFEDRLQIVEAILNELLETLAQQERRVP